MSVGALAGLAAAAGTVVLLAGLLQAARAPRHAAAVFARAVILALEFFLAAGLLRLGATMTFTGLATVVGVIATRRLVATGLRRLSRAG